MYTHKCFLKPWSGENKNIPSVQKDGGENQSSIPHELENNDNRKL